MSKTVVIASSSVSGPSAGAGRTAPSQPEPFPGPPGVAMGRQPPHVRSMKLHELAHRWAAVILPSLASAALKPLQGTTVTRPRIHRWRAMAALRRLSTAHGWVPPAPADWVPRISSGRLRPRVGVPWHTFARAASRQAVLDEQCPARPPDSACPDGDARGLTVPSQILVPWGLALAHLDFAA